LIGQDMEDTKSGRVIAAISRSNSILQRSCGHGRCDA
jgi:hypothetical protein